MENVVMAASMKQNSLPISPGGQKSSRSRRGSFNAATQQQQEIQRRTSFMMNESSIDKSLSHWAEYKVQNHKLNRRCYHSAVMYENSMYIYGGYESNIGLMSDMWRVNLAQDQIDDGKLEWFEVEPKGEFIPGVICRHKAVTYQDHMYVYGGQINSFEDSKQFIKFNFKTEEWSEIEDCKGNCPTALDSYTIDIWDKSDGTTTMILFGGFMGGPQDNGGYSNAIHEYNFETNTWELLYKCKELDLEASIAKNIPIGRMSHASTIFENKLYTFGGFCGEQKLNDLWCFDLTTNTWTQMEQKGLIPEARNGHTLMVHKDMLMLFGGIHDVTHEKNDIMLYNLSSSSWQLLEKETKWMFTEEENKSPRSTTSKVSKTKSTKWGKHQSKLDSPSGKPSKFGPAQQSNFFNVLATEPDAVHGGDLTLDTSTTSMPTFLKNNNWLRSTFKSPRYTKLKLQEYKNPKLKESASAQNFNAESIKMSNIEERKQKEQQAEKDRLLEKFEVKEKEAKNFRVPTPTTETMRKCVEGLTFTVDQSTDFNSQKQILEMTKATLMKNSEKMTMVRPGIKPCARDGHSMVRLGSKMFIFGGDRHKMSFNDVHALNLDYISMPNQSILGNSTQQ